MNATQGITTKKPEIFSPHAFARPGTQLLDAIQAIQASVGDGLSDDEFTRLLQNTRLPNEAGFAFLSYCNRVVMLSVPTQNSATWYRDKGWVTQDKENLARKIATKHGLLLYEPPDVLCSYPSPLSDLPHPHHHLEMSHKSESVVIVHPHYLKVRLFHPTATILHALNLQRPLELRPDLLRDLSELYET